MTTCFSKLILLSVYVTIKILLHTLYHFRTLLYLASQECYCIDTESNGLPMDWRVEYPSGHQRRGIHGCLQRTWRPDTLGGLQQTQLAKLRQHHALYWVSLFMCISNDMNLDSPWLITFNRLVNSSNYNIFQSDFKVQQLISKCSKF